MKKVYVLGREVWGTRKLQARGNDNEIPQQDVQHRSVGQDISIKGPITVQ